MFHIQNVDFEIHILNSLYELEWFLRLRMSWKQFRAIMVSPVCDNSKWLFILNFPLLTLLNQIFPFHNQFRLLVIHEFSLNDLYFIMSTDYCGQDELLKVSLLLLFSFTFLSLFLYHYPCDMVSSKTFHSNCFLSISPSIQTWILQPYQYTLEFTFEFLFSDWSISIQR